MKKIGLLQDVQKNFILLFMDNYDLADVLKELDLNENDITDWITNDPLFVSSLNSSMYLKTLDTYIKNMNLKRKALDSLERHVVSGDLDAIKLSLENKESFPEYDPELFTSRGVNKELARKLLSSIERDIGRPPWYRSDDDEMPPF